LSLAALETSEAGLARGTLLTDRTNETGCSRQAAVACHSGEALAANRARPTHFTAAASQQQLKVSK